ncbi:MAG: DNA topoisomerase IB [Acidobacteria bacterium]|nr:DNA topoisomerase IB [Acidobacteriota bacterium]
MDVRRAVDSARAAGLHYATDNEPGLARERRGQQFVYRRPDGRLVRDAATLERIRGLVVPPAWTGVWIALDPQAHLQATGRDAAGRKQYRYHSSWTAIRDSTKYERLLAFSRALPAIRRRIARDIRRTPLSRDQVLATVVSLLERTSMRIGNAEYARANGSHGLTTLRDAHVRIRGRRMRFRFRAKSGVLQTIDVEDARLAGIVRRCQDLPGQTLFQYLDDRHAIRTLSSSDVNAYLRHIAGDGFTAKDFRTWTGTLVAASALDAIGVAPTAAAAARHVVAAVDKVAGVLGNTRAVCRKCYVHPAVFDAYARGLTIGSVAAVAANGSAGNLHAAEARLVALLRRAARLPSLNGARKAARAA